MEETIEEGRVVDSAMVAESGMVGLLNKGEIDMQIATAHKYPRSIKKFRDECLAMVTLTEEVAESCIYALPRGNKTIEGPSARFAEIIASSWGNCRAGARTVSDQGDFVTAQGVFHDLERNVAITYEVQRRILDKHGRRFNVDMIGVTANAACSIALRNAILKGVPKAFWDDMYQKARQTVMGDFKTLANRRADAITKFQSFGVTETQLFTKLGVTGVEDITLEHLVTLRGLITAIKEGDTTPEQAFAEVSTNAPISEPQSKKSGANKAPPPPKRKSEAGAGAEGAEQQEQQHEDSGEAASPGQIANIRNKIKALAAALGKDEAEILDSCLVAHQLKKLDGITVDIGNRIQTWITQKQKS